MQKNYSLSLIRCVAMIMIVACHWLQARNNWLAWHLNVGVDIFFALSGYCFGGRDIKDIGSFFKRRFTRILIPYFVFLLFALGLFVAFACDFTIKDSLKLFSIQTGPQGFGHVWFVPCILVLYLFTPYLQRLMPLIISDRGVLDCIRCGCIIVAFALWSMTHKTALPFQAFAGYFFGYSLAYSQKMLGEYRTRNFLRLIAILGVMCFVGRVAFECSGVSFGVITQYLKFVSGCGLLCAGMLFFRGVNVPALDWTDRYSYEVYLCHHIFLLGPLSCKISSGWGGGVISAIIMIVLVNAISGFIIKRVA